MASVNTEKDMWYRPLDVTSLLAFPFPSVDEHSSRHVFNTVSNGKKPNIFPILLKTD